jgi:hypothetical protein
MEIDPVVDKVEFKGTVVDAGLAAVETMVAQAGVDPESGAVYFYDTKALALFDQAVILRARTLADDRESTVKLRPAAAAVAAAAKAANEKVRVELDIAGAKQSLSAKLDKKREPGEIEAVAGVPGTVPTLFSDKQRALIALHAPGAPALEVLRVLGPIAARRWTLPATPTFPHPLAIEEWSVLDAMHFMELSIKVDPADAVGAHAAFLTLLADHGLQTTDEQKTPQVLKTLAAAV